jgi:lipopolysaccharide biosynthesis regulator YciM
VSAALLVAAGIALGWAIARDRGRRRRWREAERLSRCLFAAAGLRRRYR